MTEKDYNNCVSLYADNVYRFVVKNLRHEEDAKDVVQTAFERLWKNKDNILTGSSKSFLFTVAYNAMIDHIRKNRRYLWKTELPEDARTIHRESNSADKVLHEALARLSHTQKSLVMLKDYEGYSYEEIGRIMKLNPSQVKVYLHRARLILRDYIGKIENVI